MHAIPFFFEIDKADWNSLFQRPGLAFFWSSKLSTKKIRLRGGEKRSGSLVPGGIFLRTMSAPPYLRLYRHVLECIFDNLGISELARISATCRDWLAAVQSMRPINARAKLKTLIHTPRLMMRHISEICMSGGRGSLLGICQLIKQSKSLTKVDLRDNSIDNTGATALADAIKQSKSLTNVNLRNNSIRLVGAVALAEAIKLSKSLGCARLGV